METIKFNGCEYLDFSDNYSALKAAIQVEGKIKVCWDRPIIDESYPRLVQFCKKRGRLNYPEACLCKEQRMCSDYNEFEHCVSINEN